MEHLPAVSYPVINVTVNVAGNATSSITNNASVSGGGEVITGNDTATDVTTVLQPSDLTIASSHTGNFSRAQTGATYSLTVSNSGTGATSGTVTVTDTLPTGLTATGISGTGWSCILGTLTCTRSDCRVVSSSTRLSSHYRHRQCGKRRGLFRHQRRECFRRR